MEAVAPLGSGSEYALYDDAAAEGLTYYRLRIVDLDGSISYSKTVTVFRKA